MPPGSSTGAGAAWPPAVVVHGFDHAMVALAPGRPVTLLSGPAAAVYGGAGWWRGLVEAARASHPGRDLPDLLDCADAPGAAMAALRLGLRGLVLDPACPAFPAVVAVAATLTARVLPARPAALDLAERGAARRLAAWLDGHDSTASPG